MKSGRQDEADDGGAGRIVFVGNARCYHTMDWYRTVRSLCGARPVVIVTDLVESEGHVRLVNSDDHVIGLFNVDWLLFARQSKLGNLWRNAVKLLMCPLQALKLRRIVVKWPEAVYHAHTMYYMLLCWLAGVPFIGTPQGSEILIRPTRSRIYRYFAVKSLRAADKVTVDSVSMRNEILRLSDVEADIVQNGVDALSLMEASNSSTERSVVLSFRGMTALYRIRDIVAARSRSRSKPRLVFIYPFWDAEYRQQVAAELMSGDRMLGRLDRPDMTKLLARTVLAVSLPRSDSSPRSVYEALFAGACVSAPAGGWMTVLPPCMRERIIVVDPDDPDWFERAYERARTIVERQFEPSDAALDMFDQRRSMQLVIDRYYQLRNATGR